MFFYKIYLKQRSVNEVEKLYLTVHIVNTLKYTALFQTLVGSTETEKQSEEER